MPYSGLTSAEVCAKLNFSDRQMLEQSGIGAAIEKSYPFGKNNPLYDPDDVAHWALALLRHRGLIALGRRNQKARLLSAIDIADTWDDECPKCGGWAMADPEESAAAYLAAIDAGKWPQRVWCPRHGIVRIRKEALK